MAYNPGGCERKLTPEEISKIKAECNWVKQIKFSPETKSWLATLKWPPSAYSDFDKIKKFNLKVTRLCNKI